MASNFFKVDKGVTLAPQSSVASPQNGDVYYDSTRNTYVFRNNGASVDLQSRSDVGTASSLTSANFTATVIQSNLIKLTGSTVSNIHGITASSDAKMIVLYNGSSAVVTIKNASGTEATAGNRILTSTGADVNLNAGEAVQLTYDSTQARWIVVSTPGGSASGGTGKNYLTTYKNNPGNGNFESASPTGWSLGTTGTLSNGLPTGSPTFGSGASGNLSISTVSSGQLAGSYSLSYASSAATTQGNMLASDAFSIDLEDQAKVLTWRFYYKAQTNPGNANWSGTSSNSFGVAVWDVTNSAWLPTTASFGMTQSSGVGIVSGTVQTASNAAQLRLVVYNVNATSGAITLYFDDFSVGPQTAPIGAVATDEVAYTPTITGFGTVTGVSFLSSRIGDKLYVRGRFTSGTVTGTTASVTLGYNGGNSNVTIDSTKLPSIGVVGRGEVSAAGNTVDFAGRTVLATGGTSVLNFGAEANTINPGAAQAANIIVGNTSVFTFYAVVPISGWSSNVQMSSDTDTRVVAAFLTTVSTQSIGSATAIKVTGWSAVSDSHAGFSSGSQVYVVPVSGFYDIKWNAIFTSAAVAGSTGVVQLRTTVNGSAVTNDYGPAGGTAAQTRGGTSRVIVPLKAGDQIQFDIYQDTGTTLSLIGGGMSATIQRLSGPSVIAASETVAVSAYDVSGATVTSSLSTIAYATKLKDTHNAFSGGVFTAPVSGLYQINAVGYTNTVLLATNNYLSLNVYKNTSTRTISTQTNGTGGTLNYSCSLSGILPLLAGETVQIQVNLGAGSVALVNAAYLNSFSIVRVGN